MLNIPFGLLKWREGNLIFFFEKVMICISISKKSKPANNMLQFLITG